MQSRHANMPYFATMIEIADSSGWWPDVLRASIPAGATEQSVIADKMQADPSGWARAVRLASADLTARLAWDFVKVFHPSWKQIDRELAEARHEIEALAERMAETERAASEMAARQAQDLDAMRLERDASRKEAEAIRKSTSWRITHPLRSAVTALRRVGGSR
jgi:hypothetical protein